MIITNNKTEDFHNILSEIEDYAVIILDEKGIVKDWNKGAEKLKGYTSEEIIGKSFKLFYNKEDLERNLPEKLIDQATNIGKAYIEGWRIRKDGTQFWGSILITPMYEKNKLIGFLKITRDLTDRKNKEDEIKEINKKLQFEIIKRTEELRISESQFGNTLDNMLEGAQIHDFDWKYIYVNDSLVRYSGYTREELLGHTVMEKYPGIENTDLFKALQKCMVDRVYEQIETEFIYPDNSKAFFQLSIQPIEQGLFILSVDRTEQIKAKEKILKVNRLYNFISNTNKCILQKTNKQDLFDKICEIAIEIGQFKMAWIGLINDKNQLQMMSFRGEEAGADKLLRRGGIDLDDPILEKIPTGIVLRTGKYVVNNDLQNDPKFDYLKEDFIKYDVFSTISLPIIKFGKTIGILGFYGSKKDIFDEQEILLLEEAAMDISFALEIFDNNELQKTTEELLLRNEKRFRSLIEKSSDMKTLTSPEGNFIYASPSVSKVFEYSNDEFLHKSVFNFFHPDDIPDLLKNRNEILKAPGNYFNFQYRLLHKSGQWLWCEGTLANMLHEPGINALVSNFRDVTERKLAEQEKEFDTNNFNALINNTNDLLWSVDTEFKLITCNQPFFEVIKMVTNKAIVKGDDIFSVVVSDEQLKRFKLFYTRAFQGEIFTEIEYISEPVESWSEISFYPIRSSNEIIGTACHSRDITERKKIENERERMIAEIIQRNKNFEQFSFIVSHNLRAPVANILGLSNLLKQTITDEDRIQTQQLLFVAVENLDKIVNDLNNILQIRTNVLENKIEISLSKIVDEIKLSINSIIQKDNIEIITDFSEIDTLITFRSYLHSIFYNLILNSIQFRNTTKGPQLTIKSSIQNKLFNISFLDNGIGIDLERFGNKLFGLYQIFNPEISGKGLGLFMVKTQVEVLGGTINVKSEVGKGTEFIIEIPL